MNGGVSGPFIRHPVATTLLMVAILLAGAVAYPLLPVAPLPQIDFPTISVSASLARRLARYDGLLGRPAARAADRADSRRHPDDVDEFARRDGRSPFSSTSTATSTRRPTTSRPRSTPPSGQLPKILPSPPTYRKVNPSDTPILILSVSSDVAPITEVDDAAENILAQQISQISGVSLVRVGGQQQPAIRIQIDPAKLVEKNLQLEDVRAQIGIATVDSPKGSINGERQAFTIFDNDQLTHAEGVERRHRRLSQRRAGAHSRHRAGGPRSGRRDAGGLGQRQARRVPRHFQIARRQRHQDRREDQADDDASASGDPDLDARQRPVGPHHDHPRRRPGRAIHPDAHDFSGRDGDFRLPPKLLGDGHSEHHGAAGAARRVRPDVGGELQPRQSFADGADDRGGIRRRRRHRRAGKHHPLRRRRHEAVPGGAQGRGRDRLHRHVDLAFARRGADTAAADDRHHRPIVPRIRGDAGDDHPRLGDRVADADPDDGLALPEGSHARQSRPCSTS